MGESYNFKHCVSWFLFFFFSFFITIHTPTLLKVDLNSSGNLRMSTSTPIHSDLIWPFAEFLPSSQEDSDDRRYLLGRRRVLIGMFWAVVNAADNKVRLVIISGIGSWFALVEAVREKKKNFELNLYTYNWNFTMPTRHGLSLLSMNCQQQVRHS